MTEETPKYKHDETNRLGYTFRGACEKDGVYYDIYVEDCEIKTPKIIARFGDEPNDYHIGIYLEDWPHPIGIMIPDDEEKPKYKHDCTNCVFLGPYAENNQHYDLYVCPNDGDKISTVIARYSDDGPEYFSGLYFAELYEKDPDQEGRANKILYEALKRAEEKGYQR